MGYTRYDFIKSVFALVLGKKRKIMYVDLSPSANKATSHYLYSFLLNLNRVFFNQSFEFSVFRVDGVSDCDLTDCHIVYSLCDMIRKAKVLIGIYTFFHLIKNT
jgi:hypothetical protein